MAIRVGALTARVDRLLSIQYLRAVAALAVVIYHAMRWTQPGFSIGAAGVDIFFVVSGFILWTIAAERPVRPGTFLKRRWVRVAPLYWILTLIVAASAAVWPRLFWDANPTWRHLLLSLAFVQHLNPVGQPFPVITVGWSLNYEAGFYLIFALSLFAPRRWRVWALTAGLIAVPLFGIFVFQPAYYLGVNMMFLQFVAGVWIAEARMRGRLPERNTGWALGMMGVAIFAMLYGFEIYDNLWRPMMWGVPAALIVLGMVTVEARGGIRDIPVLRLLGDASYSIYLGHFVAIQLLTNVMRTDRWPIAPVGIAAGVAAGLACYYLVERPMLAALRPKKLAVLPCEAT